MYINIKKTYKRSNKLNQKGPLCFKINIFCIQCWGLRL